MRFDGFERLFRLIIQIMILYQQIRENVNASQINQMEIEQGWINSENLLNKIDEAINKICIDLDHPNNFNDQVRNDESNKETNENIFQTQDLLQKLKDQIRHLQHQVANIWSQTQQQHIETLTSQSNLKDKEVQNIITKIKRDLPQYISFQRFISQAYYKTGNYLNKGELFKENVLHLDYQFILNEPLYGINFSDQYYHNEEMAQILEEYRAIVTYFCMVGLEQYNLKLGVQINQKLFINGKDFATKLAILFKTTYRKLQQDMFNVYKQIIRLNEYDLKVLYRILFNYKQYLTEQQLQLWCNLMKKSFNIQTDISSNEEISLYKLFMILIKDNRQQYNTLEYVISNQQNKIVWNLEIEQNMCRLYLAHKNLRTVLEQLNHKHNQNNKQKFILLTERILRGRFENILLRSLKKAEIQFNKIDPNHNYSVLLKSRQHRIILRAPEGLPTRLLLLKLHLNSQISLNNIYQISKSIYSVLKTKLPSLNGKVLNITRRNEIKAQMRANLNNNIHYHAPSQSQDSQSVEQIHPKPRRNKNRYVIDSDDDDQITQYKPKRSKHKERQSITGRQQVQQKGKKQLTIMETYQQKQRLRNNNSLTKNIDYSKQIKEYHQSRGPKIANYSNGNTHQIDQKNRTDLIVNDITRKIRMDLSVKRPRR